MNIDDAEELKDKLRSIAIACAKKGPGFAQEGVVLHEARSELRPKSLRDEQRILEAWHRLFADREFAWGYNLDNPGAPFFHSISSHAVTVGGAD
jgi:hypothetical protein